MVGISVCCPDCGQKMAVRTSSPMSNRSISSYVYCKYCDIRANAITELRQIQKAVYSDYQPKEKPISKRRKHKADI